METLGLKMVFSVAMFAMAMIAGVMPFKLTQIPNSRLILGMANSFAGGIFMSIAFIHLLPEVSKDYTVWVKETYPEAEKEFPLPFVLLFLGYSLILYIDKVMFENNDHSHQMPHSPRKARNEISKSESLKQLLS
jgi:solute carrier family 39 (zinc transporter), member 1/2/3